MHMPVSRVEPFTRVYKRPNPKMDGHSQPDWFSLFVFAHAWEKPGRGRFPPQTSGNRIIKFKEQKHLALAVCNRHIFQGISIFSFDYRRTQLSTAQLTKHTGKGAVLT